MIKLRSLFRYSILLILYIIFLSIFYSNYQNTVDIINSEYKVKHQLVEQSIYNTIKYADVIGQTIEEEQNKKMHTYSLMLLDKYRQQPNVHSWNLAQLKEQLGDYEIYIINQDLKVIATTFKPDYGLDFSVFPSFSKLMRSRLEGTEFNADKIDLSTNTGQLMKYSYMPTPDHKYLIELGLNVIQQYPVIKDLDTFSVAKGLADKDPSVREISIYKRNEQGNGVLKISKVEPYHHAVWDNNKIKPITKAINTGEVQVHTVEEVSKGVTSYKYIPYLTYLQNGKYSWWNSYVIEIAYNDNVILSEINKQKNQFYANALGFSLVYLSFVIIITYLLRQSEHMAYHDHLTKLPNRKLFEEHIDKCIVKAKRNQHQLAILFLDLNKFKEINDTLGHKAGDSLLQQVAERLQNNLRSKDIVCRLGGDEFIILLPDVESTGVATMVAAKLSELFKEPFVVNGNQVFINTSIGISIFPENCEEPEALIQMADMAMYHAKNNQLEYAVYKEPDR